MYIIGEGNCTHSSTLAWKLPWTEEPGRLQSMGSLGIGQDWVTSLSLFTFMHWRRKWQPIPVILPRESQGQGSLVGCCLWGPTVRHNWSNLAAAATGSIWYKNIQNTWFFKVLYIYIYIHTHTHVWGGGAQYATGDQWRNNSKKMKGWSQSKNNMQLWMWLVMEARSDAVKSNTA